MRLLPVVLVSVSLLLSSAGQAAERKFSIFGFDDIRIGNGVDVVLTSGKGPSARAEGSNREILDRVSLQKNGKQLVVSVRPKSLEASKRKRRRLNETKTTTLKAKAGSGSSSLSASETTSSVKRLAATPITPEVEEGELR